MGVEGFTLYFLNFFIVYIFNNVNVLTLSSPGPKKGPPAWYCLHQQNETEFGSDTKSSFSL